MKQDFRNLKVNMTVLLQLITNKELTFINTRVSTGSLPKSRNKMKKSIVGYSDLNTDFMSTEKDK